MKRKILILIVALVMLGFYVRRGNNYKQIEVESNDYYAPDLNVKDGNYFIDNKYIKAVSPETKKTDFVNYFEFYEGNSNLKCDNGSDFIGTGCSLQTKGSNSNSDWYEVVITGDIDGNGINSITDVVKIAMKAKEKKKLDKVDDIASDVDYDNEILIKDSSTLSSHIISNTTIPLPQEKNHKNVIHLFNDGKMKILENKTEEIQYKISKKGVTISSFVSENESVATVSSDGKVTAKKAGSTNIKIIASNGDFATLNVTVTDEILPTGVSLSNRELRLKINETKTLVANVSPTTATNKAVKWSSSNSNIVSVDSSGKLTAKSAGTATITATTVSGNKSATCTVTVYIPVTGISVNNTTLVMNIGTSHTLTANVQPSNASNKNVKWSISDLSLAQVKDGVVSTNGKRGGTVTVTAESEDGGFKASCEVKIMNGYGVLINPSHQSTNTTVSNTAGRLTEKDSMYTFSFELEKILKRSGYEVILASQDGDVSPGDKCWTESSSCIVNSNVCPSSDKWAICGPREVNWLINKRNNAQTAYIALHSNATGTSAMLNGPVVMFKNGNNNSTQFAQNMCDSLTNVYTNLNYAPNYPCMSGQTYYEPNIYYVGGGVGSAILIEIGFHDNPANQSFIENNQTALAEGIKNAIDNHFGVH